MSETDSNKNSRNDEIDLLELFRRMGRTLNRWIQGLGRAFLISLIFILRRWIPLGLSIVAGLGISYIMKLKSPSAYTSDMVIRNNLTQVVNNRILDEAGSTSDMISKIEKLHQYCVDNNKSGLSTSLSMKDELVNEISDINAYWIIDQGRNGIPDFVDYKFTHNAYDTVNIRIPDRLDIRIVIHSPNDLAQVRDGIIKYIEKDSLYQQRYRLKMMQNKQFLARLDTDIKLLDSLQRVKYFEETKNIIPEKTGQIIFMQDHKTQLVYSDIYLLYDKKQQLESDIVLYKGILTILSDFSSPVIRENGVLFYSKRIIPIIFILTLLLLIGISNHQRIKDVFRKY